jgi:nitroreductase
MNATLPTSSDVVSPIERAAWAPSRHNTQPWRFRITGGTVDLFAEPTRVRDVAGRSVPHVVLRLGEQVGEPAAAPRRAVVDIVEAPR